MITKKQKAVLDFITTYTDENGISPTQKEIKDHFNLRSFGSVQRYLKYLKEAGLLTNEWNSRRGIKTSSENVVDAPFPKIPILGLIAAGNPIEAIENCDDYINIPQTMMRGSGTHFGLKVEGESMIDLGINDGDLAIIRSQKTANKGEIVAAVIDGEATLKTFIKNEDKILLLPANQEFKPIDVTNSDFQIAGILTGLLRSYH